MGLTTFSPFGVSRSSGCTIASPFELFYPFGGKSEVELPHVADANARLSIDPTGKIAGYRVIQDDGPTTYEFLGAGLDTNAGLWVTESGNFGAYTRNGTVNGRNAYLIVPPFNSSADLFWDPAGDHGAGAWVTATNTNSVGDTTYPWEADWSADTLTVERNAIADPANWTP